jgi:hypothetical protein
VGASAAGLLKRWLEATARKRGACVKAEAGIRDGDAGEGGHRAEIGAVSNLRLQALGRCPRYNSCRTPWLRAMNVRLGGPVVVRVAGRA